MLFRVSVELMSGDNINFIYIYIYIKLCLNRDIVMYSFLRNKHRM